MTGKRPNDPQDMETVKEHLNRQDKTLNEILILIRGSVAMGVDGIISKQKDFENRLNDLIGQVAHYEKWRQKQIEDRGKLTITFTQLFTRVLAVIGALGSLVGIVLAIKELSEK